MSLARRFDAACLRLQAEGKIGFYLSSSGHEAVSIGLASALDFDDRVYTSPLYNAPPLVRGAELSELFDNILGKDRAAGRGRQAPGHFSFPKLGCATISGNLGAGLAQATGAALALKQQGKSHRTLACFGESSLANQDFLACSRQSIAAETAIIYATPSADARAMAELAGLTIHLAAANDLVELIGSAQAALANIEKSPTPQFIAITETEADEDPLTRYATYLSKSDLAEEDMLAEIENSLDAEIRTAIAASSAAPPPGPGDHFEDVTAAPSATLKRQREIALQGGYINDPKAGLTRD